MPGDITITADHNTDIVFRNCALLSTCEAEINDLINQNYSTKFETESIISSLCNYFDTFILVTGDTEVTITDTTVTNCAVFSTCKTPINDLLKQINSANFETESVKSSPWGYFDAFILVPGYITVTANNNTDVTFPNCTLFSAWN